MIKMKSAAHCLCNIHNILQTATVYVASWCFQGGLQYSLSLFEMTYCWNYGNHLVAELQLFYQIYPVKLVLLSFFFFLSVTMIKNLRRHEHVWNRPQLRMYFRQVKNIKGTQSIRKENDIHTAEYYFENGKKTEHRLQGFIHSFYRTKKSEALLFLFSSLCKRKNVSYNFIRYVFKRISWPI